MWRTESRGKKGINDVDGLESRKKYNLHINILTTCIGVCPKYLPPRNTDFVIGEATLGFECKLNNNWPVGEVKFFI